MSYNVTLHIYDLSQGIAAQLSKSLLNKDFKAVYHTGVSVHNTEYFYGGGIQTGVPEQTPYGTPIEKKQMGTTEKSIKDIYAWIQSKSSEFSEASYNLMTHNCNHFSHEFLQFLGISDFPNEILSQPDELLSTPLGGLFNNMFGGSSTGQTAQIQQKEAVNKEYETLYIKAPKVFICDDEQLLEYISTASKDDETKKNLNTILAAYNESKNYKTTFNLECDDKIALNEVLALISTTSSIENIPEELKPSNLVPEKDEQITSYFRYLNNWMSNQRGMVDARKQYQLYVPLLRQYIENSDYQIKIAVLRSAYTFSRIFTTQMQKATLFFELLLAEAQQFISLTTKESQVCLNLCCGSIGRMILSFSNDPVMVNSLKLKTQKSLDINAMKQMKAPCVKDLAKYIGLKCSTTEDEFF